MHVTDAYFVSIDSYTCSASRRITIQSRDVPDIRSVSGICPISYYPVLSGSAWEL